MATGPTLIAPPFEVGRLYRRRTLHGEYGGQRQGGISTPHGRPYLFLFTGTGEHYGYHDGWDKDGVFLYSGEGQSGDMTFRGGNKALRDHAGNGKDLVLFEQVGHGQVRYRGCFACSTWEYREAKDRTGKMRKAIVFHLIPSDTEQPTAIQQIERPTRGASVIDLRERAYRAATAASEENQRSAKRIYYERSLAVREYVLRRANGTCEACSRPAPFARPDGSPYLEAG